MVGSLDLGFNARAVEEGRSFARVGEPQFDPSFTLTDDVTKAETTGLGFDIKGTPKRRVEVVLAGVTTSLLHTRRTAAKAGAGAASTGHALEGAGAWGALGTNLGLVQRAIDGRTP